MHPTTYKPKTQTSPKNPKEKQPKTCSPRASLCFFLVYHKSMSCLRLNTNLRKRSPLGAGWSAYLHRNGLECQKMEFQAETYMHFFLHFLAGLYGFRINVFDLRQDKLQHPPQGKLHTALRVFYFSASPSFICLDLDGICVCPPAPTPSQSVFIGLQAINWLP